MEIAAIIISIVSIIFTFWQIRLQRTHNKKSVKPIGQIVIGDYDNEIFVKLENSGIGPMIVTKSDFKKGNVLKKSLIDLMPNDIIYADFIKFVENKTIRQSQSINLLKVSFSNNANNYITKYRIKKELQDIFIEI